MTLAISAFVLTFASMVFSYLLMRTHLKRKEARVLTSRVAPLEQTPAIVVEKKAPTLIRKDQPEHGGMLQTLTKGLHIEEYLRNLIETSAAKTTPVRLFRSCLVSMGCGCAAVVYAAPGALAFLTIPAAMLCGPLPILWLKRKKRRRLEAFQAQFPNGLEFISRSMRAGHAFSVSLEMLYREFDDPMAGEFRRIFEEQNLGLPLEVALGKFAARIPLLDVQFFISAVLLQRKTGGNLTEILDKLAHLIRERYKLRGKIRSISAHGRLTGKVLSAIPIFVGALMFMVNKEYGTFFAMTTEGREMIGAAAALQVIGYLAIQKIVKIEI